MTNLKFIKILTMALLFILSFNQRIKAQEITKTIIASGDDCGPTCHWELDNTGHIVISGTGSMYNHGNRYSLPWNEYLTTITSVEVQNGINYIGGDSFRGASSLTEVSIAPSVTYINNSAFHGTKLKSVIIPPQVSTIGYPPFADISTLTEVFCSSAQVTSGICTSDKFSGVAIGRYEQTEDGKLMVYDANGKIKGIYSDYATFSEKGNVVDSYTQTDENGNPVTIYDGYGNIQSQYAYNSDGSISIYDANGKLTGLKNAREITPAQAATLVKKGNVNTVTLTFK